MHPGFGGRSTRHKNPPFPGEEVPEVTGPGGDGVGGSNPNMLASVSQPWQLH